MPSEQRYSDRKSVSCPAYMVSDFLTQTPEAEQPLDYRISDKQTLQLVNRTSKGAYYRRQSKTESLSRSQKSRFYKNQDKIYETFMAASPNMDRAIFKYGIMQNLVGSIPNPLPKNDFQRE